MHDNLSGEIMFRLTAIHWIVFGLSVMTLFSKPGTSAWGSVDHVKSNHELSNMASMCTSNLRTPSDLQQSKSISKESTSSNSCHSDHDCCLAHTTLAVQTLARENNQHHRLNTIGKPTNQFWTYLELSLPPPRSSIS
jgi:hypothetical protein